MAWQPDVAKQLVSYKTLLIEIFEAIPNAQKIEKMVITNIKPLETQ